MPALSSSPTNKDLVLTEEVAQQLVVGNLKRTRLLFLGNEKSVPKEYKPAQRSKVKSKIATEYAHLSEHPLAVAEKSLTNSNIASTGMPPPENSVAQVGMNNIESTNDDASGSSSTALIASEDDAERIIKKQKGNNSQIVAYTKKEEKVRSLPKTQASALTLRRKAENSVKKPQWHAPWKLKTVISGHVGWVRSVAVDPTNEWFATGSADRTIKIWDLAAGKLKLTLTGHIGTIRGLAISDKHPYMFSAAEDKMVKCWDLEYNRVVRHYHGHLSGVYSLKLHPMLPLVLTGGRDAACRVWDMRTAHQVHILGGHKNTVTSIVSQGADPQVITSSEDKTIRLWDLRMGKAMAVLTNHKKGVRSLVLHKKEFSFASAGGANMKKWLCPKGKFLQNLRGHKDIVNCMALNDDDVLVSGGNDGKLRFWDWKTGYCFQNMQSIVQPGSLDSECSIFDSTFDLSGSRLITCEADKSIKIWKEDETATEETHPIDMKAWTVHCRQRKRY